MNWSTFVTRGKKAMRMPPRVLLARLQDELRQQTKRPWASVYPRLLSDRTVLGGATDFDAWWSARLQSGPFFLRPSDRDAWITSFRDRCPAESERIVAAADKVLAHEFDLLGSGPKQLGATLPWHSDFKTGREWPPQFCKDIEYLELDRPTDVKVPWELSRAQHFPLLGQAYWITGDEKYAAEFAAQVDDWLSRNPLAYGVNWACAMDVALRAVSWVWGLYFMGGSRACQDTAFRRRFARALYMHGEFVSRNLETSDINGNHYLSDAVGLVFMGVLFRDTSDGLRWLSIGEAILNHEIGAQIYEDGVDHEASTPYHRLVLELFLTGFLLLEHAGRQVPAAAWSRLERMLDFVAAYTKPNGLAPLIGDADDGRVQKLGGQDLNDHRYLLSTCAARFGRGDHKTAAARFWDESFWLLGPPGATAFEALPSAGPLVSTAFPQGGYYVLRNTAAHVVIDCGDVGMRGRGGHGHNDILSFELFMNGANIVTDCGAYLYTASPEWRNKFRSTAFHNTMQVDGEETNRFFEPTALWQLHDDAKPIDVTWRFTAADGSYWSGAHTGYRRLPQACTPSRMMWMDSTRAVVAVRDDVRGTGRHRVTWRWHLDPSCTATLHDGDCRIATARGEVWMLFASAAAGLRIEPGWVSASYGVKTGTQVLVLDRDEPVPMSCSYVFADARLDQAARADAMAALARASAQ